MILSIVIMMKDEEKYLDKTLSALIPIMKEIKSELIILDTGSSDRSVDIARKYTSNIYFDNWNNDFAAMRNKAISRAQGEWVLILDADEEVCEYDRIINFFKSEVYKNFNSASVEIKNLSTEDGKFFTTFSILRLFKKDNDFKYVGPIHEQPVYKHPIYKKVMSLNHYGYIYEDEELKQKKLKRNEELLLSELEKNPTDPYICYQLSKNFTCYGEYEEGTFYMEKALDFYNKLKLKAISVESGLASLYIHTEKYKKCEKICKDYIKKDDKNIDIYYYLATAQMQLKKYEESISNYNKYIYLLKNYELSTQYRNITCDGNTISFENIVKLNMIKMYFILEKYEKVIEFSEGLDIEDTKKIYFIIFMSFYKTGNCISILGLYKKIEHSKVDSKIFEDNLENMILKIKKSDRPYLYEVLSNIDGNYGLVNKVRCGNKLTIEEYNYALKEEIDYYYGDLIYYSFKQGLDLIKVVENIDAANLENYFTYITNHRKDCIVDLYKYLKEAPITIDINKLKVYSILSKVLLIYGNLKGEKYKKLFLMYLMYGYNYLTSLYTNKFDIYELTNFMVNKDERFVINIVKIQKIKDCNQLKYLSEMKKILIENPKYKKGIEFLISDFEKEFKENFNMKDLKKQFKSMIEVSINQGNIKGAEKLIAENESMFGNDVDILNMKAIIKILNGDYKAANSFLKEAYILDINNFNTIFNIGYLNELMGNSKEAVIFYNIINEKCDDKELLLETRLKTEKMDI